MVERPSRYSLEPTAQGFIEGLDAAYVLPIHALSPHEARAGWPSSNLGRLAGPTPASRMSRFPSLRAFPSARASFARRRGAIRFRPSCTSTVAVGSLGMCTRMTG